MPALDSSALLTADEVAAFLRCSLWKVRHQGHAWPGYFKFGRSVRWGRAALEAWVARSTNANPND